MKRVERTATIATPPAELFAYLADLQNLDEWMAGIVSAEVTSAARWAWERRRASSVRSAARASRRI